MTEKMKESVYKLFSLLLCFIMFLSFFMIPVEAEESEEIKVGWYEDSYHMTGKNGERSGYSYEYEQYVASYTSWKYKYINGQWSELLEKLENGDIDLMAAISYTDERAQKMLFSKYPMGEEKYYLYADLVNTNISASDLSTLNGKNVALLENSVQATKFYEWEEENHIKTNHVFVNDIQDAQEKIKNHEVACVISTETPIWVEFGMSAIVTTGESDIYYVINKKRPDLKEKLDEAMRKMEYDKPFYGDDLYKKYLSAASTPVLSSDEQEWLEKHGNIKMGYIIDDSGFSFYDEKTGKLSGVINDYLVEATKCLSNQKLNFEVVGFKTQKEQIKALKEGKIDVIFHFTQNPYIAQKNDFILSTTVLNVPLTAITTKKEYSEDHDNTVAIAKNDLMMKWAIAYNYPNWKIKEYNDFNEVEGAVKEGKADCFVVNSNSITEYSEDSKLHCVSLIKSGDMSFALGRNNSILMSILNKTLKTMSTSKLTGALSMYTNSLNKVTLGDFIKDNYLAVIIILAVILSVVTCLLRKSRVAERKVKQAVDHSNELNEKLQENKKQLEEALVLAKEASNSKTAFLNNMSHDIRTPMNAIIGFTDIARKQEISHIVKRCLDKIKDSSELLLSLINEVLDISKIESGKTVLNLAPIDITSITDVVIDVTHGYILNRNLKFNVTRETPQHPYVYADAVRIREILVNLLSNAVKFTNDGGIITFDSVSKLNEKGQLVVKYTVSDTGIGMSEEFQKHIFEEFAQEYADPENKYHGTGLGMSITKRYVDMMNGKITLQSEKNKGSTFIVEIPLELANKEDIPKVVDYSSSLDELTGLHVLLAEDNELNAEIAILQLEEIGMQVTRVKDGKEAIDAFKERPKKTFDIILMDIMMPQVNGYEATKVIRSMDGGKTIPIIAMTANAFAEDVKASFDAGMNDHISKPIDQNQMINIMIKNLHNL